MKLHLRSIIFTKLFLLFLLSVVSYAQDSKNLFQKNESSAKVILGIENVDNDQLISITERSIKLSADYLKRNINENGRFNYLNFLNEKEDKKDYNELRHAGTIFSLEMFHQMYPEDETLALVKRSVSYLRDCCIIKVPGKKDLTAVWTNPYKVKNPRFRHAKLGGSGLALVSLATLKKIDNKAVDISLLRQIGDFILFLQKEDGSYYSKYKPLEGGRDDSWTSLYYPGEAALGLSILYEIDKDPKWINGAIKTISYLAKSRKGKTEVPADHWAMLATAKIFELSKTNDFEFSKDLFVSHSIQVCNSLLEMFFYKSWDGNLISKPLTSGRAAPIGTRLEGLLAAYTFLPDSEANVKENIKLAAKEGLKFLASIQVVNGEHKGGFPGKVTYYSNKKFYKISPEIRIDYVQHAMSAQIQYLELFGNEKE